MNQLLDASVQFPTVIFTIGLGICLVYWLFVLLGALDIDLFGGGDASGAVKGGIEGLKGVKVDHDLDGGGFWHALGLATVPVTISVSAIMLVCWIASLLGMRYASSSIGSLAGWLPAIVLLAVVVVGIPLAGLLVRPLAPVFEIKQGKSNRDYVGHTCTITTGHVDDDFGQATVEDGGTVLVIPVRCDRPGALARGHKALIIDFDDARAAYVVEPTAEALLGASATERT
ncbi:MAG: hypothetical protein F9K40_05135 [Kofleriaceae bacterium]|nr:MAG: hypothetical protein F9K40_05135 [Kofleriaceae bacterium]MBZ0233161.1 hypothetical protein [Kofleriaceae bacterium]